MSFIIERGGLSSPGEEGRRQKYTRGSYTVTRSCDTYLAVIHFDCHTGIHTLCHTQLSHNYRLPIVNWIMDWKAKYWETKKRNFKTALRKLTLICVVARKHRHDSHARVRLARAETHRWSDDYCQQTRWQPSVSSATFENWRETSTQINFQKSRNRHILFLTSCNPRTQPEPTQLSTILWGDIQRSAQVFGSMWAVSMTQLKKIFSIWCLHGHRYVWHPRH